MTFLGANGKFLATCNYCWGASPYMESVMAHWPTTGNNFSASFTPIDFGNGKWALQGIIKSI